jgi:LysM repeat protein
MNTSSIKIVAISLLFLLLSGCVVAQKFITHTVKEGETIESIAKQYRVTPSALLSLNKEIKQGQAIKPNTILVVPASTTSANGSNAGAVGAKTGQEEPIGFGSHSVGKKETLYSIAKRYNITEDEIKRYNRDLYSAQLKKGMSLRIPKYKRTKPVESLLTDENFETYVVQEKETRWSIIHKYGITKDSLLALNPELAESTDYLAIGQQLRLPKIKGSTIKDQDVQMYNSYTVPKMQTFYSLQKQFGVTSDEVIRLNPEVKERGLQEGMIIRLPVQQQQRPDITTENFVFYEVKPKQTEFSLTRKLGVSYKELLTLNPALAQGLKAGMVLKIPKANATNLEVKNALILDKINLLDSINTFNKPKLVFLLPFRLDKLNLADTEATKATMETSNALKYSMGLYSGALVALDSIKKLGISVDVRTYDTQLNVEQVRSILASESLQNVSAIVGPLDAKALQEVAVKAATYDIPVIAPLASGSDISLQNVFFASTSDVLLRESMLTYASEKRVDENVIIIADENNKEVEQKILERFPYAKVVRLKDNLSLGVDQFNGFLSKEKENWVFLETDNFKIISSVSSILNSAMNKDVRISLLTTDKNKGFDNEVVSITHLSNLRFTYPSLYKEAAEDGFVKLYRKRFETEPDRFAVRGFDVTYDLLLKLAYKNNLFEASKSIGLTQYSGNKFDYTKDVSSGYFNTASYIIRLEQMELTELK